MFKRGQSGLETFVVDCRLILQATKNDPLPLEFRQDFTLEFAAFAQRGQFHERRQCRPRKNRLRVLYQAVGGSQHAFQAQEAAHPFSHWMFEGTDRGVGHGIIFHDEAIVAIPGRLRPQMPAKAR